MGRIEKVAGLKHEATISPALAKFAKSAAAVPIPELPSYLASFPRRWPFPRGDLYHWIAVLNRFDKILARVVTKYELDQGPQTINFGRLVLSEECLSEKLATTSEQCDTKLNQLGYGQEGDRELVESILDFSRLLLERCGNRSLFSSSDRLNALLNTYSLSLLQCTLRIGVCLAQRYYSRQRSTNSTHFHQSLLAAHYNVELDRVQKLAAPFPRPSSLEKNAESTPSGKGKEKAVQTLSPAGKCNANNLISLTRTPDDRYSDTDILSDTAVGTNDWADWGTVRMSYYPRDGEHTKEAPAAGTAHRHFPHTPTTPTPSRRTSGVHLGSRLGRDAVIDDSPVSTTQSPLAKPDEAARGMKVLEISTSEVLSRGVQQLLKDHLEQLPKDSKYELLNRLRIAYALAASTETRQQLLAVRVLAITNLAFVYPETMFQQKILHSDSNEPKRLQLPYQLAEFVHLGVAGDIKASVLNQSYALSCLDALARHKSKAADVCAALNVNVNHGILMFVIRKTVADIEIEDDGPINFDNDDWRDALFSLLRTLPNCGIRTPETLVSAGLIPLFVDILNVRTEKARRVYPRVMEFLDTFVHPVRDALATLASARGFDALSGLISSEAKSAFDLVAEGKGIPEEYKTPSTDYQIPYFHQQSLRWLFKFVNHVMQHNSVGFERLLRNLIDSPPLLGALRLVLENARIFGSHVWSGAVNIMSHFIHNEPTSYAVIAEAGLSKSFLEAIMNGPMKAPPASETEGEDASVQTSPKFTPATPPTDKSVLISQLVRTPEHKGSDGIMASSEAILCIPLAFGAICLNGTGLHLFQSSDALERFFDIFESPEHIKCMKNDGNLLRALGSSFDELVRHHPALKSSVMSSVLRMVARVGLLAKSKAWECGLGTKLWVDDGSGNVSISGGPAALLTDIGATFVDNVDTCQNSLVPNLGEVEGENNGQRYKDVFGAPSTDSWDSKDSDRHDLTAANYIFPVLRFLTAFFENQSICSNFIESGGVEYVLDLATLQSLPFDFHRNEVSHQLAQVIHLMSETKPHLVVPSLVDRTQKALDQLEPFWSRSYTNGFFTSLTQSPDKMESDTNMFNADELRTRGAFFAKHLVAVQTLTDILREAYTPPIYPIRPSQQASPFTQANLADKYANLVKGLGKLQAACVWEEILLQKNMPETWNDMTKAPGFPGLGGTFNDISQPPAPTNPTNQIPGAAPPTAESGTQAHEGAPSVENTASFKNVKTLRYLLSCMPASITGFLNVLGHGLITKRRIDTYQRQKASMVADAIASMILGQLNLDAPQRTTCLKERFSYLIVILSSFSQLLFDTTTERPHSPCLTVILYAFKKLNGVQKMKSLAELFLNEIKAIAPQAQENASQGIAARLASAYGGIKIILTFFSEMISARYVIDSAQTQSMASSERERDRADAFIPHQFLVELRMEALPLVQSMWGSSFVEDASSSIVKTLIEILRSVLECEYESGAFHRGDTPPRASSPTPRVFSFHRDRLASLMEKGYGEDLTKEAMYRCNNSPTAAEEYCKAQKGLRPPPRNPIPSSDLDSANTRVSTPPGENIFGTLPTPQQPTTGDDGTPIPSFGQALDDPIAALLGEIQAAQTGAAQPGASTEAQPAEAAQNTEDNHPETNTATTTALPTTRRSSQPKRREVVTVEDLDDEREKVRSNLIERCLEVLNVHHDVTFELADLIGSATKFRDSSTFRKEVGETLIHFLISLQMDENFDVKGKKIAAYANLLALALQDRNVYESTLVQLKENFSVLLGFINIPQSATDKSTDEACPWIAQVLLIMEKVLSDDEQPAQISWTPQSSDKPEESETPAELKEPNVPTSERMQLFEAIVNILPRIGKDDSLALSVCRILVILTRNREIASRLGEKRNMQRLFVMIKQLANAFNEKLQSTFMLVLRHVVEDEDTIRQIMRKDIVSSFESRSPRQTDTTGYVRQFYHLAIRSPQIFVEVTNDTLKLQRYDEQHRQQILVLKQKDKDDKEAKKDEADAAQDTDGEMKAESSEAQPTTEKPDHSEGQDGKPKPKTFELKTPIVENPDGVIHYLLSELLSYRDVDDKEPPTSGPEGTSNRTDDVEMATGDAASTSTTSAAREAPTKKAEKPQFKAEEHPIYIYRCFLLQCLTELLSSYNRTKVEFINYSRKADPLATTPSKPRSGILNYLLHSLIPLGTLEHDESISFKKRVNTSNWAMRVVAALCTKTGEFGGSNRRRTNPDEEDEPELLFVRKFVLEHALKSYKEASASQEPLDVKYSRLMCLADLFDKMLSGAASSDGSVHFPSSNRQIAKTMFEKNYISAFTTSISDIDLNFPSSKRAVKYILRPLNKLTQTAVLLSETGSIQTPPGGADEDEISSATSVSDIDNGREETPDLFRHSTLGMFEVDNEEETTSDEEEEDEEMYDDDEYDEEMDYEEDMPENDGEVVSDEEIDARGPIEGLPGDHPMDIEFLVESGEDEDDEDDEDEDDEDDEDEDEDEEGSSAMDDELIAGEITGDNDNDSLHGGGDDDEWESEDMSEGDEHEPNEPRPAFGLQGDDLIDFDFQRFLNAPGDEHMEPDMGIPRDLNDDLMDEDDMNEEDEDEEIDELEEEVDEFEDDLYQGYDDEDADANSPWGWDDEVTPHPRFQPRTSPWSLLTGGLTRHAGIPVPGYRTHRSQIAAPRNDDGTNPLLRRTDRPVEAPADGRGGPGIELSDWVHAMDPSGQGHMLSVDSPVSFMNAILQMIGQGGPGFGVISRPDGLHVHLDRGAVLPSRLQELLGLSRPQVVSSSRPRDDPGQAVTFSVTTTSSRWQEEARLLFGNSYIDKAMRTLNSIFKLLVPPAVEEEKRRQKQLEEELKRREEERVERERQERAAKEEAEKEQKRKEEEEEALKRQQEEERAAEERARQPVAPEPMEGVQPTEPTQEVAQPAAEAEPAEAGPSEPAERVHTTIRGRQLDITGMEIDPEYLDALPEELREEVIMQQLAEQRSHAAASGEEPTEINSEFLEALPPEIREELLQQEAADRRRRERETARRQAAATGAPHAEDMDPASFIATLDPSLRQTVLADQPDDILASLGPEFVTEARALTGRRLAQFGDVRIDGTPRIQTATRTGGVSDAKPQRRQVVQMLDKAGVATLLRLMFMPLHGNARHHLNDILHQVCQNRQNRMEVISLLLLILQDGSADISAVERSFAHLSLRARTPTSQKTPQSSKRNFSLPTPGNNGDVTPLVVIQQCLGALSFLTQYNPHIAWFFLTEHDAPSALKLKALRKGKCKENKANKYALNSLLSLLDRKAILDSPNCMEQLSSLLSSITHPLTILLKKEKEKQEEEAKAEAEAKEKEAEPATRAEPEAGQAEQAGQAEASTPPDTAMTDATPAAANEANQDTGDQPSEDKPESSKPKDDEKDQKQKKQRMIEPPVVPEHNLRLVVHILAARECNGKTFRETLSTINNLSSIPDAKEVIGKELVSQAQALSRTILVDLNDLLPHISQAKSGTDVQGMALSKFSPASSDQAKLLRVLTALDYLFDPTRADKDKTAKDSPQKEDVLKHLYESAAFGPLWTKLSECLSSIRQKENMLNVATTLLPLIESLMVVCKNTTLKDMPLLKHGREFAVSSPPPESGMEGLFFSFTEEHRKILNELVRQNPRLMSGTFSLLVKNPKVLEFDNKRNYFNRRIHSRGTESRHPHPPLQLNIRRDQVFLDSFKSLYFKSADEMKYGKLNIRFHGEEGVDAGGVSREWFQVLARGMFNPNYALFIPVASDRTTFHPNRLSGVNQEHLMFFKFVGRIIGKALYEGRVLDCHFSRAVYKRILSKSVSVKDMETLDLDYYKSLLWMLENDITDIITENFAVEVDDFGEKQVIDLVENGRNIPVTQENKEEYIQRVVEHRLVGSVKEQLDNFLKGFHDIIPADLISIFNEQELELLISGLPEIDVDDWKNNSEYHNYSASSPQIQWFWRAVRSFDKEERAKLLQFVTGTSKVPLNGFRELEGMNGFSKFNIHRDYGNKDRLPSTHTCFNQLDLPEYENYETLRERLYTAITAGSEYFGFA